MNKLKVCVQCHMYIQSGYICASCRLRELAGYESCPVCHLRMPNVKYHIMASRNKDHVVYFVMQS